jgi:hypothetical protein
MQWGMIKVGEGQTPGNRDCVAFIDPKTDGESKQKARDEESSKDCEGEPIFRGPGIEQSIYSQISPEVIVAGTATGRSDRFV